MKGILAFFRLIRWPNLAFVLVTQFLFWAFVIPFVYRIDSQALWQMKLGVTEFLYIAAASISIAAGGYVINDYFDVNIDQVNKSGKVIIGTDINRRMAILLHAVFSLTGLLFSFLASSALGNPYIFFFNLLAVLLLVLYSTTFKKKLLVGNVLISLLTAWVIGVMTLAEFRTEILFEPVWQRLLKCTFVYGGFAFVISLIREAIKDMEDLRGDARYDCSTIPIKWGLPAAKIYTAVWLAVLSGLILSIAIYLLTFGWWAVALYAVLLLILPLLYVLKKLVISVTSKHFHRLSSLVKWIMMAGILSMLFFNFHR